jgi:hypothetical protein
MALAEDTESRIQVRPSYLQFHSSLSQNPEEDPLSFLQFHVMLSSLFLNPAGPEYVSPYFSWLNRPERAIPFSRALSVHYNRSVQHFLVSYIQNPHQFLLNYAFLLSTGTGQDELYFEYELLLSDEILNPYYLENDGRSARTFNTSWDNDSLLLLKYIGDEIDFYIRWKEHRSYSNVITAQIRPLMTSFDPLVLRACKLFREYYVLDDLIKREKLTGKVVTRTDVKDLLGSQIKTCYRYDCMTVEMKLLVDKLF